VETQFEILPQAKQQELIQRNLLMCLYAHAMFQFFLRNPVCQEMGRKFKMSFSSSDKDTGLSYLHDLGFIQKL
jgi:sulfite reductase beta subunit-like hemoprotein